MYHRVDSGILENLGNKLIDKGAAKGNQLIDKGAARIERLAPVPAVAPKKKPVKRKKKKRTWHQQRSKGSPTSSTSYNE